MASPSLSAASNNASSPDISLSKQRARRLGPEKKTCHLNKNSLLCARAEMDADLTCDGLGVGTHATAAVPIPPAYVRGGPTTPGGGGGGGHKAGGPSDAVRRK